MLRRLGVPDDVDLRDRAEGALAGDADFVSALHRAFDFAFDREAGLERVFELSHGGGTESQPAGERQPSSRRHDRRLDAIAHLDLDICPRHP